MSDKTPDILIPSLRQYQHNDCSGLLAGFDYDETVKIVTNLQQQILDICQPQWNIGVNYPIKDGDVIVKKNGRIFLSNISGGKFNCGDQGQIECYQYYNYPRTPHE